MLAPCSAREDVLARKPTDTIHLKLRFEERLRRRLEREAKKRETSMNSEIIRRLEWSLQRDDEEKQVAKTEEALMALTLQPDRMPKEQIGAALIGMAALGGARGRRASMAAIGTEEGGAAALEWIAREEREIFDYAVKPEEDQS
jgi:hypothetical protein